MKHQVNIRLTPEEYAILKKIAASASIPVTPQAAANALFRKLIAKGGKVDAR